MLKGGEEAANTNAYLVKMIKDILAPYGASDAISLIEREEDCDDLLKMDDKVDLVIPRGSSKLVKKVSAASKGIPVLSHSFGTCHVYLDKDCEPEKALRIGKLMACNTCKSKDLAKNSLDFAIVLHFILTLRLLFIIMMFVYVLT